MSDCVVAGNENTSRQGAKIVLLVNGVPVDGSEIELPVVQTKHPFTGSKTRILKLRRGDRVTFQLRNNGVPRRSFKIPIRRATVSVQMLRWW